jgi:hypothetical protein
MKAFGVLDLETEMEGCRFSIGLRNSHDKSMRLAITCGYRVFVCSNMAFAGDFTPVLAKHSKSFSLIDCISVGVDRMQRNFEPMRKQEAWHRSELTDVTAKVVIYEAFVACPRCEVADWRKLRRWVRISALIRLRRRSRAFPAEIRANRSRVLA